MKEYNENDNFDYRSFPLYGILVCGILLLIIGIYQIITDQVGTGIGRHSARIVIYGPSTLAIGLGGCILTIYLLKKNKHKKRKQP